jgi:hypothetical protein
MPALVVIALSMAGAAGQLRVHISSSTRLPSSLIVGRAVCSHGTWLLTEHPDLILITHPARQVTIHRLEGLRTNDRPWGLACLADGTLWSLATPRVLIRISAEGVVRERVELRFPRVAMFGWGDRLLFIDLPMLIAKPLLATAIPRARGESMPWPRFLGRAAEARADLIARNLVNCGIGNGRRLPCWFADERRVVVSDGASANTVSFDALSARDVAPATPIWDLAMGGADTLWLLAGARGSAGGSVSGARLIKTDGRGTELATLALVPSARMIVAATDTTCVLLAVDGRLMEVIG